MSSTSSPPLILAADPRDPLPLWERMYARTRDSGRGGMVLHALSAVDIVKGKALGVSVSRLLGGRFRERVRAYPTGLYFRLRDEFVAALVEEARGFVREGFRAIKLKIGLDPATALRHARAVRGALGADVDLMVNAKPYLRRRDGDPAGAGLRAARRALVRGAGDPRGLGGLRRGGAGARPAHRGWGGGVHPLRLPAAARSAPRRHRPAGSHRDLRLHRVPADRRAGRRPLGALPAALQAHERPEVIVHQAAQLDVRRSVADPAYDADVNLVGALRLVQRGLQYGLKKVVFASSGGALYGETEQIPTLEDHPTAPISPYGVAKLSFEHYLHYYHVVHGLAYVALRYANVYGPRQSARGEAGVVAIFCERLIRGKTPTIYGDGENSRDYVYVGDVVEANRRAVASETTNAYNVGTGIETTVNELFAQINMLTGANRQAQYGAAKLGEQRRSCLDFSRIQRELGWHPEVGLAEGLARTVASFHAETAAASV